MPKTNEQLPRHNVPVLATLRTHAGKTMATHMTFDLNAGPGEDVWRFCYLADEKEVGCGTGWTLQKWEYLMPDESTLEFDCDGFAHIKGCYYIRHMRQPRYKDVPYLLMRDVEHVPGGPGPNSPERMEEGPGTLMGIMSCRTVQDCIDRAAQLAVGALAQEKEPTYQQMGAGRIGLKALEEKLCEADDSPREDATHPKEEVPCPCTMAEQDETCPVGMPSLLCGACKGTGHTTQDKVTALAVEMIGVAYNLGAMEDPFAAWENLPNPHTVGDDRPCVTDTFLAALINDPDGADPWEVGEAITNWVEGSWDEALGYLSPAAYTKLTGKVHPDEEGD